MPGHFGAVNYRKLFTPFLPGTEIKLPLSAHCFFVYRYLIMVRTLIVDDELNCIEMLELMLGRYCPELQVLRTISNPLEAPAAILDLNPDLIFLDIEMPGMTGFDLLEKIKGIAQPDVIFTTAHNEYAIKAFKYAAVDYLLKPVDALELKAAVLRSLENRRQAPGRLDVLVGNYKNSTQAPILALASQEGYLYVRIEDIVRCEADGAYTKFFLTNGEMVIVSHTMRHYEDILTENNFFRVHDKHIVNLRFVKKYLKEDAQVLLSDGARVDVSRRRKDDFLKRMNTT